jgi:hypothetical protein
MANWISRLPPEIQAKFAAYREHRKSELLTFEECRTIVRTLHIIVLLRPEREAELAISLKRFAGLARMKRKRAREAAARILE